MAHRFVFTLTVELTRTEGKFAGRDEMADALIEEIEGNAPTELYGLGADGESAYEVTDFMIEEA